MFRFLPVCLLNWFQCYLKYVFAHFYISKYFGIYEWEFINVRLIEWTCRQFESQCRLLAACRAITVTHWAALLCISVYITGEVQKLHSVVKISLQRQFLIYLFISGRRKWAEGIGNCLSVYSHTFHVHVSVHNETGKHHKFSVKNSNRNNVYDELNEINGSLADEIKKKFFYCVRILNLN